MKKLVMVGGGGHCKSVLDVAQRLNIYSEIVITDPELPMGTKILDCNVVGDDQIISQLKKDGFTDAFISVGSIDDTVLRKRLAEMVNSQGFSLATIIDPSAVVSKYVQIGEGTFVGKNAVINADVKIGSNCIINTGCILEHECVVGDFTHISVGSILCGSVRIGNESFVGAGSTIIQGVGIGSRVIIGAGSLVLSNVGDGSKAYGVIKCKTG